MRRRLSVYTFLMIAGIAAGFFIFEKLRLLTGAGFLSSMGIMAILFFPKEERGRCLLSLLIGFVLIGLSYADFESYTSPSEIISGRVLSVTDKGEYTRLIVKEDVSDRRIALDVDASKEDKTKDEMVHLKGALIETRAKTKEIRAADNPGCFDYRLYMRSMGISGGFSANSIVVTAEGDELIWRLRRGLIKAREGFLDRFDEETGAFLRGVIFGDKSEIDDEILREFNLNSSGHILAVSGLHIGFLYSLLKLFSRDRKTWGASFAIISLLLIYGEMTEWSSSTLRAVIVLSSSLIAINLRRNFDLLSSLSAAAVLILVFRPYMLFNSGFQMSFAAMGAIAFLSKRLSGIFGYLLGVTFAVQIGTIPVIAIAFKRINLLAFTINIPIIMLSSIMVPVCIFFLILFMITGLLPAFAIRIIDLFCDALIFVNHTLSFDGSFSGLIAGIKPIFVIAFYASLVVAFSEWTRIVCLRKEYNSIIKLLVLMILPAVLCAFSLYDEFSDDEIVFLAVGQGDCVHVSSADKDILIDGGGSEYINTGERILMPYLLSQGVSDLDMAFVTHLHKDHYQGIAELSDVYPVKSVCIPSDYENSVGGSDINTERRAYLSGETRVQINDELSIESIWPLKRDQKSIAIDDPNEHNMVYMIDYMGLRVMITGDLLEEDEAAMLRHYKGTDALKCDILKIAHHASKSSSSAEFLDEADPKIAVIQVGRNNIYGHPHSEVLDRLYSRGIEVYRTDLHGAVGIDIGKRKRSIKVDTMRPAVLEWGSENKKNEAL